MISFRPVVLIVLFTLTSILSKTSAAILPVPTSSKFTVSVKDNGYSVSVSSPLDNPPIPIGLARYFLVRFADQLAQETDPGRLISETILFQLDGLRIDLVPEPSDERVTGISYREASACMTIVLRAMEIGNIWRELSFKITTEDSSQKLAEGSLSRFPERGLENGTRVVTKWTPQNK